MPRSVSTILPTEVFHSQSLSSDIASFHLSGTLGYSSGIGKESMRVLGTYALVYVAHGKGYYRDESGHAGGVETGDLILVLPEMGHTYGPEPEEPWTEVYFVFSGPAFDLWRNHGLLDLRWPLRRLLPVDYWLDKFRQVGELARIHRPHMALLMAQQLLALLAEAEILAEQPLQDRREEEWLRRATHFLGDGMPGNGPPPDLRKVARQMGMSYESFRKKFAAMAGVAPGQFQLRKRIDQACALLYQSREPIKQIAHRTGFCDEFHFSRMFKRITGQTPTAFRARWQGEGSAG